MNKGIKALAAISFASALAACGGGSDSGADSSSAGNGGPVTMGQNGAVDASTGGAFAVQMLGAVNNARAQARTCGTEAMAAVPSLTWNALLMAASAAHAEDMAKNRYFSHTSQDGRSMNDRAEVTGYKFTYLSENLASGTGSLNEAMSAWLKSPGHCAAIMSPNAKEMGAYMTNSYWVQMFGAP